MVLSSLFGHHLLVCMPENILLRREWCRLESPPRSDPDITELLESLRRTLAESDGPKHDVPEVLYLN